MKYEYQAISLTHTPSAIAKMNELGQAGWMLVATWGDQSTGYMMRELED